VAKPKEPEIAPVPEDNLPGHHPDVEQDKPTTPPRTALRHQSALRRDEPLAAVSRLFGVNDENSYVKVDGEKVEIRFGPWHMTTPLSNVASAEVSGPFAWWKVIGPPRLSLADRGVTFATSTRAGVCLRFREPVAGIEPRGVIRHPGATVTVEDPEELARVINELRAAA
jgi:hypothetical protein